MAYLMDGNAMRIAIRPRPWHPEKELPHLVQHINTPFFLGGGNFAMSPRKAAATGSIREVVEVIDNRQIDFDKPEPGAGARRAGVGALRHKNRRFVFDHVFRMDATQDEVYENTAKSLLDGVLKGFNATVFAYGATGCGKTHTISGTEDDPGIIARTVKDLFERIDDSKDEYETHLELSMVEIYNEMIRDLLSENFPVTPVGGLKLLENQKERVAIADVRAETPKTVEEVLNFVGLGNERRSTSYTESNSVSSRSHAVLQINITRNKRQPDIVDIDREEVMQDTTSATLSIIDLAGSERASATRNMGERMKEGAQINKSLLALSSCIAALCDAQKSRSRPHVPYRNSKLTRLLKFSLGGNCRTVMICCVSPSSRDIEDTNNTLVWANRAKNVKTMVTRNTGGTAITARQYVVTISQQADRIRILEKQVAEFDAENSELKRRKLLEAKKRAAEAISSVEQQVRASLLTIDEGAELRAKWDVASLAVSCLESRRDEVDDDDDSVDPSREKGYCDSLAKRQNDAFQHNRAVQAKVAREQEHAAVLETLLKQTESRAFADLDEASADNVRFQVRLQRSLIAEAVAAARERGYRSSASRSQDTLARCAIALVRYAAIVKRYEDILDSMITSGSIDAGELQKLLSGLRSSSASSEAELSAIFGSGLHADHPLPLPPSAPSIYGSAATRMSHLSKSPSEISMTMSNKPKELSKAALLASPAAKRLLKAGTAKGGYTVGSPRKGPRQIPRASLSGVRSLRFPDQTGEGSLSKIRMFQPRSSQSPSSFEQSATFSIDEGDESADQADWEEVNDVVKPLKGPNFAGLPRSTSSRASSSLATSPLAPFRVGPAATDTSVSGSANASTTDVSAMPEWKKNRIMLGKANAAGQATGVTTAPKVSSGLSTLNEVAGNMSFAGQAIGVVSTIEPSGLSRLGEESSDMSFASSSRLKFSKPIRSRSSIAPGQGLGPLSELHQIPSGAPRPSSSLSSLLKPTASSAARSSEREKLSPTGSSTTGSSTTTSALGPARRLSTVVRHERSKLHSGAPYGKDGVSTSAANTSVSSTSGSGSPLSVTAPTTSTIVAPRSTSALSSGPRRMSLLNAPAPFRSRMSLMGSLGSATTAGNTSVIDMAPAPSMGPPQRAPRHSISMNFHPTTSGSSSVMTSGMGVFPRGPRPSSTLSRAPLGASVGPSAPWR